MVISDVHVELIHTSGTASASILQELTLHLLVYMCTHPVWLVESDVYALCIQCESGYCCPRLGVWDTHHMSLQCLQNGNQVHSVMTDC